jgi:hypothetical protein
MNYEFECVKELKYSGTTVTNSNRITAEINHRIGTGNRCYHGLKYSGTSVYVFNPFQILGLIPNRTYTKRIFPIRNKGKMINPFP